MLSFLEVLDITDLQGFWTNTLGDMITVHDYSCQIGPDLFTIEEYDTCFKLMSFVLQKEQVRSESLLWECEDGEYDDVVW